MSTLYAVHHFKQFMQDEWLAGATNEGPFVLGTSEPKLLISITPQIRWT